MLHREYLYAEVTDALGNKHSIGSLSSPVETSVDGVVERRTVTLATATSLLIWNSAEAITNFDKLYLLSDTALKIELTVDRGGEVGSEELVLVWPANDIFKLGTDDALALYTGTLSGGTQDVIDEIYVRNESGAAATIEYMLVT